MIPTESTFKTLLLAFISCCLMVAMQVQANVNDKLLEQRLCELDELLLHSDRQVRMLELRIAQCRSKQRSDESPEVRYQHNMKLYQHYMVYDSDSAMSLLNANQRIAAQLHRKDWLAECRIEKSFIYTATGMLKEAEEGLNGIDRQALSYENLLNYYDQMIFLYSHFSQYHGHRDNSLGKAYLLKEMAYRDSIDCLVKPENPLYLWYKGWKILDTEADRTDVVRLLKAVVDSASLDSRLDAMNAYILAKLYERSGNARAHVYYLALSATADVRICNRDIASLYELGHYLHEQGDIDRAYSYIHYCLQQAQLYRNRIRMLDITQTMSSIHQGYLHRNKQQQQRLKASLLTSILCALVLLLLLFFILRLYKKLNRQRLLLVESNLKLSSHVQEITSTRERLTEAHAQLQQQNAWLEQTVSELKQLKQEQEKTLEQLRESNYVKEEYIAYVFTICSSYIDKLNEYRKGVNRKLKAGQLAELKQQTDTPASLQVELKEFYHTFDTIFLNVYPNFVSDFNALLRPEEQIVLREGELLNTDLRIYALVRLGINDSTKIASFLHCSPQTVYNNRLKIRNKAIVAKENFAQVVGSLGKYGQNV
ncbi:MAG: DUF6377 domain-containing protein [Bacteroides sp.]